MIKTKYNSGFTLIELLVSVSIISLLTTISLPSLMKAKQAARKNTCLSNLQSLGTAMSVYLSDNNGKFWPYALSSHPSPGQVTYFWGSDSDPVDPSASPFMSTCDNNLEFFWCPEMKWGDYVPQGSNVSEPTTTYAYNGRYLSPDLFGGTNTRDIGSINKTSEIFVFADAAMCWAPGGVKIMQNSTYLEPVTGSYFQMPTNHFRHSGKTNALCADGHAQSYTTEGGKLNKETMLGFVGTDNSHYGQ